MRALDLDAGAGPEAPEALDEPARGPQLALGGRRPVDLLELFQQLAQPRRVRPLDGAGDPGPLLLSG